MSRNAIMVVDGANTVPTTVPDAVSPSIQQHERDLIREALIGGERQPELRHNWTQRRLEALIGNAWLPLDRIRQVLTRDLRLADELLQSGADLDWLLTPVPTGPDRLTALEDIVDRLASRRHDLARLMASLLLHAAERVGFELPTMEVSELAPRVLRAVGGVAQTIEQSLPRDLRRSGAATLFVTRSDDGRRLPARWEGREEEAFSDLRLVVIGQAALLGEFSRAAAAGLADVAERLLFTDGSLSPFPPLALVEAEADRAGLQWRTPGLRAELLSLGLPADAAAASDPGREPAPSAPADTASAE